MLPRALSIEYRSQDFPAADFALLGILKFYTQDPDRAKSAAESSPRLPDVSPYSKRSTNLGAFSAARHFWIMTSSGLSAAGPECPLDDAVFGCGCSRRRAASLSRCSWISLT